MLHSLFYLETALHVSGGTSTHHQERKQLYLQHQLTPQIMTAHIQLSNDSQILCALSNTMNCVHV